MKQNATHLIDQKLNFIAEKCIVVEDSHSIVT